MITTFSNDYAFLSNFYECKFEYQGEQFKTVEHAFQAYKTTSRDEFEIIKALPLPFMAKRAGKVCTLRPDWESVKIDLMVGLVYEQFVQNRELASALSATGLKSIVEVNNHGDNIWGMCPPEKPEGQNLLGLTLMMVRTFLNSEVRLNYKTVNKATTPVAPNSEFLTVVSEYVS